MPAVLVTGANRGIGLEFTRQYAADGWRVYATVRSREKAYDLQNIEGDVHIHILDVNDRVSVRKLAEDLSGDTIDVLIANAGMYGPTEPLGSLDVEGWMRTLSTNAIGPVLVAEAFLEHVARSSQKKMVAISSKMGSIGDNTSGGGYAYRSSKAALNAAWKSLAHDVGGRGIVAVPLHPGWVRTDMGGPNGLIDTTESVSGLRKVIDGLSVDKAGHFYDYKGEEIPW